VFCGGWLGTYPGSVAVLGPNDLGWPPAHPYLGSVAGAVVSFPHDPGQHEVRNAGNHVFDAGGPRSGNTS